MNDPLTWLTWLQVVLVAVLLFGAALERFTVGWGGLLVIATGVLFAVYFRIKNSN